MEESTVPGVIETLSEGFATVSKKLWLIALEAPQLETLRESYGLPNRIRGHDFHITLGYQVPAAPGQAAIIDIEPEELDEAGCSVSLSNTSHRRWPCAFEETDGDDKDFFR